MPAALTLEHRESRGDAVQHPFQIGINHLVPFVGFQLAERGDSHKARVIDQHIHALVGGNGSVNGALHLFLTGDIGFYGYRLATLLDDAVHQGIYFLQTTGNKHQ